MNQLRYVKPERLWLKSHPALNERWLQERIAEEPGILGLGDLVVLDRERRQERAGRLDLLLADLEENVRYEVELLLGATDESHIIRCIEYWDIERRRYPGYEHCAVLVAEDITTRFLNLLALFAGNIPLIAIQLNALRLDDQIMLDFVRVLDQRSLRQDDETETPRVPTDRQYWNERSTPEVVKLADGMLGIINQKADPPQQLNYNKHFIGLTDGLLSRNFVYFRPRKQFTVVVVQVADREAWVNRIEEAGLSAGVTRDNRMKVTVSPRDLQGQHEMLTELLHHAVENHQG